MSYQAPVSQEDVVKAHDSLIPIDQAETRANGNTVFGWLVLEDGTVQNGNAVPDGDQWRTKQGQLVTHWANKHAHLPAEDLTDEEAE